MPLYEYVCDDCDSKFDALVRSLDTADQVSCRSCSGEHVRRLVSSFAAIGGLDEPFVSSPSSSGGCCGGSCGCGHA